MLDGNNVWCCVCVINWFHLVETYKIDLVSVGSVYKAYQIKPRNGSVKAVPSVRITDNEEQLTTKDVSCGIPVWFSLTKTKIANNGKWQIR